jgi:glc operon protein GlcG
MKDTRMDTLINRIFDAIEVQIPAFRKSKADWDISDGNVAVCIITEAGRVYGRLFGSDKLRQRHFFNIAFRKASQVWITGHKTGEYESIVFGGGMDPEDSPIELPDLIGWVGGQPIQLDEETKLAVGFSGFRGFNDIEIVRKSVAGITY